MKLLCIRGAVLAAVCLAGGGLVKISFQSGNETAMPKIPSEGYYEIHNDVKAQENENNTLSALNKAEVNTAAWNLLLVNPWNYIPEGFTVELTQLKNGQSVDKRAYPDLQKMMDDMRSDGLSPLICSSYRTNKKQQELYANEVNKYSAQGYSHAKAREEAGKWVAAPGTSEHQTGLAVDIVDMSYQILDEKQESTAVQKWLMDNSWRYGFILRYPSDKGDITGINYEPWHYRYVGIEAAKEIYEKNICFEEYLQQVSSR